MLFGLGVDGVVLLYVAHRLALADGQGDIPSALAGPSTSMLLGMWTTAATFYGLMFVDFPEPGAARPAPRAQHDDLRRPDADHGAGAAPATGAQASVPRAGDAAPRGVDFTAPARGAGDRGALRPRARHRRDPDPREPDTRSPSLGHQRRTARIDIGPSSACRATCTLCWRKDRRSSRCCSVNERLDGSESHRSFRLSRSSHRRAFCRRPRSRTHGRDGSGGARLSPETIRASLERARVANDFTPGAFEPFVERCPGCSTSTSGSPTTDTSRTDSAISSIGSSSTSAAGGRWPRICFRPARTRPRACWSVVSAVDPSQTLTGLTLVNRELSQ